ncbi:hypothetical protein TSOC_013923 [Tetrabaena socialis]|uniref:Uncharacterized protein n=1 Tax=Tetrabaena socialis TaxID=47790 RepID=A0A2J7ZJ41_9CHLO|nr:hypothetical protein TSOC_013923 [Tetrabaena socialis]|eukprot:PNH00283.1 hypothetical protein TSOC_013923 [Tetrabaena socialis]
MRDSEEDSAGQVQAQEEDDHRLLKDDHNLLKDDHNLLKDDHNLLKDDHNLLKDDHNLLKDDHNLLKDDHNLLDILRSELTGQEQQLFITGFAAYLQYDTRNDFVINLDDERELFKATIEESKRETEEANAELAKIRTKIYEEIPKLDNVYVNKEVAELASDTHKVGKAIDPKKRESQLNTGSAQGSRMIYKRPTHNAMVVEDILKVAQRRYHIASIGGCEHYNNNVEHSVDVIDIAATVVDTLASSFEYMKRGALFRKVIANLAAVQGDDDGVEAV